MILNFGLRFLPVGCLFGAAVLGLVTADIFTGLPQSNESDMVCPYWCVAVKQMAQWCLNKVVGLV